MVRLLENTSILHSVQVLRFKQVGGKGTRIKLLLRQNRVCVCVTQDNSIEFRRLILDERPVTVMHYLCGCTSIASHKSVFAAICLKCVFPSDAKFFSTFFSLSLSRLCDRSKIDSNRTPYFTSKVWLNENGNVLLSCLSPGLPTEKPLLSGYFARFFSLNSLFKTILSFYTHQVLPWSNGYGHCFTKAFYSHQTHIHTHIAQRIPHVCVVQPTMEQKE